MQLDIDNWRWAGVPFFLRTGKDLAAQDERDHAEVPQRCPSTLFRGSDMDLPMRDHLTVRVQPNEGITIGFNVKQPGPGMHLGRAAMDFDYDESFAHTELADAYELPDPRGDAGDHSLFIRQDGVRAGLGDPPAGARRARRRSASTRRGVGTTEADELIAPRKWHVTGVHDAHDYMSRAYPIVPEG